jgi:hypothetical protein
MRASVNDIVPHATYGPAPERLIQFGGVNAVQPDQLVGNDDGVAVDDLGGAGKAIGTPAESYDSRKTGRARKHSATAHC